MAHYKDSPFTDLVDAYYVLRYGMHLIQHRGFADDKPAADYHIRLDNLELNS